MIIRARFAPAAAAAIAGIAVLTAVAPARSGDPAPATATEAPEAALPSPADLMQLTQLRHFKLWFAVKAENWALADYELKQFERTVQRIAALYPATVSTEAVEDVMEQTRPLGDAIAARDGGTFAVSFRQLTTGCNECHRNEGLGFIRVRVPTSSPFSNQDMQEPQ